MSRSIVGHTVLGAGTADNIITIYWGQTTESQQLIVSRLRADRVRDNIQAVTRLSRMMLSKFKRIPLSSSYQCSR